MPDDSLRSLAKLIDHSLLHPALTDQGTLDGCALARRYGVAAACVKPYAVPLAREALAGSGVAVCAVAGFPHGNSAIGVKVEETYQAVEDGAAEVDMVVNIGKVLGGDWAYLAEEIQAVNDAAVAQGAVLKVIFETDYLEDSHIIRLCEISSAAAVAFVKTSTGYGFVRQPNGFYAYSGATDHNLALMRQHCAPGVQIKAAGGVRTLDDLLRVLELGVTRIGASATKEILEEARARGFPES